MLAVSLRVPSPPAVIPTQPGTRNSSPLHRAGRFLGGCVGLVTKLLRQQRQPAAMLRDLSTTHLLMTIAADKQRKRQLLR